MLFFLLINVKMPTTVDILTFMSRNNFMLSLVEHEFLKNLEARTSFRHYFAGACIYLSTIFSGFI